MANLVCVHCHNPVELIQYKEDSQVGRGISNEYKHSRPRPYPICNKNPITYEDVEEEDEEIT